VDRDALFFGTVDDDAMERGAGNHDGRLAVPGWVSGGPTSEKFAVLVLEGPVVGCDADIAHLFNDTGGSEDIHAIGGKADASAGAAGAAQCFKDLHVEAVPFEEEGKDGACDSAADDECVLD